MDDIFQNEKKKPAKQVMHLHRKLFLLVFAVTLLLQGWVLIDKGLADYHQALQDSFKVILTVEESISNEQLEAWGQELNRQTAITAVRLFSPEDALTVVRHKNPQLADSLLQLGKNKMPAYFEIKVAQAIVPNIRPFLDNLSVQYPALTAHYHAEQAQLLSYTGTLTTLVRVAGTLVLLTLLAFMFLVEAAPYPAKYAFSGAVSGFLAVLLAMVCTAALLYPMGLLTDTWVQLTTWGRQLLLVTFGTLFGWTLVKWQRF